MYRMAGAITVCLQKPNARLGSPQETAWRGLRRVGRPPGPPGRSTSREMRAERDSDGRMGRRSPLLVVTRGHGSFGVVPSYDVQGFPRICLPFVHLATACGQNNGDSALVTNANG